MTVKKKKTEVIADQPTATPTRKMEAVGAAFPLGAAVGTLIVWGLGPDGVGLYLPDAVEMAIMSIATGAAMFGAGYLRKERVVVDDA